MKLSWSTPGIKVLLVAGGFAVVPFATSFHTSRTVNLHGQVWSVYHDYLPLPAGALAVLIALVALVIAGIRRSSITAGLAALVIAVGAFQMWRGVDAFTDDDPPGFDEAYHAATHH